MKISELNLPAHIECKSFSSREALTHALVKDISLQLEEAIQHHQHASMAVSGGRTPIQLFHELSLTPLDWAKVTLTLADDRCLKHEHPDSNAGLVRHTLLQNCASDASLVALFEDRLDLTYQEQQAQCEARLNQVSDPLDLVILGLGNDGHTASLFPCSDDIESAVNSQSHCALVTPKTAPYSRLTLTPKRILNARRRILHICGEDKLLTLQSALSDGPSIEMPIRFFLAHPLTIYWSA